MTNEDYKNELLQWTNHIYQNDYKKKLEKSIKTQLILILIATLLFINDIIGGRMKEFEINLVYILFLNSAFIVLFIALSAGKIKKDYIDPRFKKIMYNIQVREPEMIIKNDTVFGIILSSKKRKIIHPKNVVQLLIINNKYYFLSRFQGFMLILDPVEGKKFLSQCSLKVQTRVKMVNYEYKFDEKLSTQVKNYNLKIIFLDIILRITIYISFVIILILCITY